MNDPVAETGHQGVPIRLLRREDPIFRRTLNASA
jgi:hypothetical protein